MALLFCGIYKKQLYRYQNMDLPECTNFIVKFCDFF